MQVRRRVVWLAVLLVVSALVIVFCVILYVKNQPTEFDGTLVNNQSVCFVAGDHYDGSV